ncbi:MAG: aminoacyl-tRNA hydrolase [Bacteroidales bacterium]|jgi:PTH1 family peptidyl-tRNA hydrolase|nr:aminoacyl-tRNA hydrolase [Bacteroidales bacterium]MBQ1929432.1 aminoacyl-tRNA hydrolase [Bacteroidales bacterium]MBR6540164.1 aminoacyl-tRNA hydrolase [Bacteroidales bacterium]
MNFLIVGLGNIGVEYANTRHNIGFKVLDAYAKASNTSFISGRYGSTAEVSLRGHKLTLLKPSTYMNLSGKAVNYWMQNLKIKQENILIVLDDLALPFGQLRMRKKGSNGGHNGLKNIDECLGNNEYCRLRVGISDNFAKGHQVDYVLGKWTSEEEKELPFIEDNAIAAIKAFVSLGPDRAMNIANTKPKKEE